jgi:proteasome accessory factor C
MFYLLTQGTGEAGEGIRVFRLDRIEGAEVLDERFEPGEGFSLDRVLEAGRVFIPAGEPDVMRVVYSPRVARWIAEREGRVPTADGSLVLEHPLGDPEWGLRHVLQYGAEAEVVEPEGMRELLRVRLGELLRVLA